MKTILPQTYLSLIKRILRSKWLLLYVFLLGLAVRFFLGLYLIHGFGSDYADIARNLVRGGGYGLGPGDPTAIRTPGYPLILAGLMTLFGENRLPLIILNAITGATNAALCCWLGIKVFRRSVGVLAGMLYILIPYLAQKECATEIAFIMPGILGGLCLLWKGINEKRLIWVFLAGLLLAGSYLVRSTIALIPPFIAISILCGIRQDKKLLWRIKAAAILLLAFGLGIFPWALRNKIVFNRWYIGQTIFWGNFHTSNNPHTFDIYPYFSLDNFPIMFPSINTPDTSNELDREDRFQEKAINQIRNMGWKTVLIRDCKKFLFFWNIRMVPYTDRIGNDPLTGYPLDTKRSLKKNLLFSLPYVFLIAFALLGAWQERKRRWLLLFICGLLLCLSIPYVITVVYSRYTVPVYFVLILLASRALVGYIAPHL